MTRRDAGRLIGDLGGLLARHEGGADLDEFARYADDPVGFARDVVDAELWEPKQAEIARSVRDRRFTVVLGGNGVGKDFAGAALSLWAVYARGMLVLATASAERTAGGVFMRREVAPLFRRAGDLPGELYSMELRVPGSRAGVLAMTSTSASKLTGFHHPEGILTIISEAQDVEPFAWEAMQANATSDRARTLVLGNPLRPEGKLYEVARRDHWHLVRIPAAEHPNVREGEEVVPGGPTRGWIDGMRREWGEGSPQYLGRVEARFPETSEDSLVEVAWLDDAFRAHREGTFRGDAESEYAVVGVDVARFGGDMTVVAVRRGRHVARFVSWQGADTRETAARVMKLVREEADGGRSPVKEVVVDATAVGGGVADSLREELPRVTWMESGRGGRGLREKSPRLREFVGGERAPDGTKFRNLRSQSIWELRTRLEEGRLSLPPDDGLRRELLAHKYEVGSDGRTAIVSKDEIKSRLGGASPDRVDALSMTFTGELEEEGGVEMVIGGAGR